MTSVHAVYHLSHPPTAVEHSLWCYFTTLKYKQLVLFGANKISVYRILDRNYSVSGYPLESSSTRKPMLEHVVSFQLFGNVVSAEVVRRGSQIDGEQELLDAVILMFSPARAVIVAYDVNSNDLKPLSLHDFDDYEPTVHQRFSIIPEVRVDPEMRCAAFVAHGYRLVIIPLRKELQDEKTSGDHYLQVYKNLSSFVIDLPSLEQPVTNVLDIQFLHGYFEPTLLILFQPISTWTGRLAMRKDTISMITLSINLPHQAYPIIWSQSSLPYDCFKVVPIPKPIGGALVFGANVLIYMNQSIPPFGVTVNSLATATTEFPLTSAAEEKISMDVCRTCLVDTDKIGVILKTGEIYIVTLLTDEMSIVKSFHFQKAATSVYTCCIVHIEDGCLFLGSRLANSLLLSYTKQVAPRHTLKGLVGDQPALKRRRINTDAEWIDTEAANDEAEIYGVSSTVGSGEKSQSGQIVYTYSLEVCDSLLNIGPIGRMTVGESNYVPEEFLTDSTDVETELVLGSGHDKNGAISVLQRTIKPQIVTTFELPLYRDVWTMIGPERDEKDKPRHSCLLLSKPESTAVLETGDEINEIEDSGFVYNESTVFAGNLDEKLIVQVTATKIVLLEQRTLLASLTLTAGEAPIIAASVTDLFISLLTSEGKLHVVQVKHQPKPHLVFVKKFFCDPNALITASCLYKDISGLFTISQKSGVDVDVKLSGTNPEEKELTVDEEDELLYGEKSMLDISSVFEAPKVKSEPTEGMRSNIIALSQQMCVDCPTYWVVIGLSNGMLQIFSLPDLKLCYSLTRFYHARKAYPVSDKIPESKPDPADSLLGADQRQGRFPINELLLTGLGAAGTRPYLFSLLSDELTVFEIRESCIAQPQGTLQVALYKFCHNTLLQQWLGERKALKRVSALYTGMDKDATQGEDDNSAAQTTGTAAEDDGETEAVVEKKVPKLIQRLRLVNNVSGYNGVFVCGYHPLWLLMTPKGVLRPHIMWADGAITNFANLNNVNCPAGFLYFTQKGQLRISVLPSNWDYDAHWPVRKINIKSSVLHISYHLNTKSYVLVSAATEPVNRMPRLVMDKLEPELLERDENYVYPTITRHSIRVLPHESWTLDEDATWEAEEWEHITALKCVKLAQEGERSALKEYIVTGCSVVYGEEMQCKGFIRMFDLKIQTEDTANPGDDDEAVVHKYSLSFVCEHEQKGPITAINAVEGFLVSSSGQKIFIHTFQYGKFTACAFVDATPFTLGIHTLKSFVLSNDIYKSITLHKFDPKSKAFSLISKDVRRVETMSSSFLVDNKLLAFLVADAKCNMSLLMYQPEMKESHAGQRLVKMVDFNCGCKINAIVNIKSKSSFFKTQENDRKKKELDNKIVSVFGTLDGGLGYVVPIQEKLYRRLRMLQQTMNNCVVQSGGLNPRLFRWPNDPQFRVLNNPSRGMIDGDLIFQYGSLSLGERLEIADRIGIDWHYLMDDLVEVHHCTALF